MFPWPFWPCVIIFSQSTESTDRVKDVANIVNSWKGNCLFTWTSLLFPTSDTFAFVCHCSSEDLAQQEGRCEGKGQHIFLPRLPSLLPEIPRHRDAASPPPAVSLLFASLLSSLIFLSPTLTLLFVAECFCDSIISAVSSSKSSSSTCYVQMFCFVRARSL